MKTILAAVAALLGTALACSDGGDTCSDTYAEGLNSLYSGTSCSNKTPPREVTDSSTLVPPDATVDPDACTETFAYGCDDPNDPSTCRETYQRQCPDGVVEKTLEPGCRMTRATGDYVYSNGGDSTTRDAFAFVESAIVNGRLTTIISNPWQAAIDRFNTLFNDGGTPRIQLGLPPASRGTNGTFMRPPEIRQFQVLVRGKASGFPTAAGVARCSNNVVFGRHNCIVQLVMENIKVSAALTGSSLQDIANVVALHELGHVVCIQHLRNDVNQPHDGLDFTAMNSFMLSDTVNNASRYFTYDSTEIADARQAFQDGRTIPDTVFERGFNVD